jgi:hypothetical protein
MKSYVFNFPFQGNRKGDIVTEDKFGQVLVKANEHNVRWTSKEISRLVSSGMLRENKETSLVDKSIILQEIERTERLPTIPPLTPWSDFPARKGHNKLFGVFPMPECIHIGFTIREGDEYRCLNCNKRWEANEPA